MRLLDEESTRHPFYRSRKMVTYLHGQGYRVNRNRVQRLMRQMGLAGVAPGPQTSRPHSEHTVYPYLLRGRRIERSDEVWSTDITYVRLQHGVMYLVAIIDWCSRYVLAWQLSNTLDTPFCLEALEQALAGGCPTIFNTDQGAQFTSVAFTTRLEKAHIAISMDGRGRALDNIFIERLWRSLKYEDIYLKDYATVPQLYQGLTEYFYFYNQERPHQALEYRVPQEVYHAGRIHLN